MKRKVHQLANQTVVKNLRKGEETQVRNVLFTLVGKVEKKVIGGRGLGLEVDQGVGQKLNEEAGLGIGNFQ